MFEIEELEAGQPLPGGANLLGTPQEFQTRDEVGGSRVSGAMVLLALHLKKRLLDSKSSVQEEFSSDP